VVIILLIRQRNILKENKEIKQELDKTKEELQKSVKPEVVEEELSRQLHLIIMANRISKRADDFKREWATLVIKINNEQENMFDGAVAAIERVYPDMYTTILQKYPNLNDTESKVLLLSCSDLTNTEIAYILGLSVHSVNKSRSEIRRKIVK
jgi:DNA-binding NarL/FixJ family response regulator